jgi:hypothetical protein
LKWSQFGIEIKKAERIITHPIPENPVTFMLHHPEWVLYEQYPVEALSWIEMSSGPGLR